MLCAKRAFILKVWFLESLRTSAMGQKRTIRRVHGYVRIVPGAEMARVAVFDALDLGQPTNLLVQQLAMMLPWWRPSAPVPSVSFFFPYPSVASLLDARRACSRAINACSVPSNPNARADRFLPRQPWPENTRHCSGYNDPLDQW